MTNYRCPLCEREMARDLALYLNHTQTHIIDQIKREHPEWVEADGVCKPCAEYYRKQLTGEIPTENIGPRGRQRRILLGVGMLALSLVLAWWMVTAGISRSWRLLLFFPLFGAMIGFIQAREKTCALLSERGVRDMDSGELKVDDSKVRERLKARGRLILVKSALAAAFLTALFFVA